MRRFKLRKHLKVAAIICVLAFLFLFKYTDIFCSKVLVNSKYNYEGLEIHVLDVGQAESILVMADGHSMLIDTGEKSSKEVVNSLKEYGVDKLDILMLTHFHRDHVGGASRIISRIPVDEVICVEKESFTTWYEKLWYLDYAISRKMREFLHREKISQTSAYDKNGNLRTFTLGRAHIKILSQDRKTGLVNNKSIVFRLEYEGISMLFMGDAQAEVEKDLIMNKKAIEADILKVGHHGSYTSTTEDFLDKVNPKYAVISCGLYNDYGHPHKTTMENLEKRQIELYRTDESGTISIYVNNGQIEFSTQKGDYYSGDELKMQKGGGT